MTTSKFKVYAHAAPTEIQVASGLRSSISGTLFLEIDDGTYFPSQGWGDYVIPVLEWWLDNAMRLYVPNSDVKNIFMDGPYTFTMRRETGSDDVLLTLREDARTVVGEYTISYKRCLATLRGAAKSVVNELSGLGSGDQGADSCLRSSIEQVIRLESEIKVHGLP